MSEQVEVKVIEVEANKLIEGAKYIVRVDPHMRIASVIEALDPIIGPGNYTLIQAMKGELDLYAVVPSEESK